MANKKGIMVVLALALAWGVSAQAIGADPNERVEQGLKYFEKADFNAALSVFQGIILDAKAKARHPEAVYWSALSYVGLKDYENADRSIGMFLASYTTSRLLPDAQYQQGRIAFLRQDYERALKDFQVFIDANPTSDLYSSALFWAAECMFQLGRLEQAERVFLSVVRDYPVSVKKEAANYRLGLIDLKYREEELLKLLKWSHEESLRIIEEYQRREKTYEQAINAYQKQLSGQKATISPDQIDKTAELEANLALAQTQAAKNEAEMRRLQTALSEAQARLDEALKRAGTATQAPDASQAASRQSLLDMKQEALELQEFYLRWLAEHAESGGQK
jgi:TolA-binding protein